MGQVWARPANFYRVPHIIVEVPIYVMGQDFHAKNKNVRRYGISLANPSRGAKNSVLVPLTKTDTELVQIHDI